MHNIIKILVFAAALLSATSASAISRTNLKEKHFAEGNEAYEKGEYQQAVDIYSQILNDGLASWELYYNLGNAYYRLEQTGNAILNYHRALRLAPNKQIIRDNLDLANSKTVDNIEQLPRMFLVQWAHTIARITTPRGWRILLIIAFFLTAAATCIFFIAKEYRIRRTFFVTGIATLVLTLFFTFFAAFSSKIVTNNNEAIVIEPMIVVKGSPDPKSIDKFIVHEGTLLTITDKQDQWWQISIADGKSGWINSGAEII